MGRLNRVMGWVLCGLLGVWLGMFLEQRRGVATEEPVVRPEPDLSEGHLRMERLLAQVKAEEERVVQSEQDLSEVLATEWLLAQLATPSPESVEEPTELVPTLAESIELMGEAFDTLDDLWVEAGKEVDREREAAKPKFSYDDARRIALAEPEGMIVIGSWLSYRALRRTTGKHLYYDQMPARLGGRGDIEMAVWSLEPLGDGSGSITRWEQIEDREHLTPGWRSARDRNGRWLELKDGFLVESASGLSKFRHQVTGFKRGDEWLWKRE